MPTPFAPSFAIIPQQQLIKVIANPKLSDFNIQTFKSFKQSPNQTESKYALYGNSEVKLAATAPPRIPKVEARITTNGIITVPAIILGVNK